MPSRLRSTVHRRGDVTFVRLAGVIDEDNDLSVLAERVPGGTLVVDLGEVERINSCGVRDWVNWLHRVEGAGAKPVLVDCSPPVVAQINLVHNFVGGGAVKSFYAPYFCPQCDREKLLLLEARDALAARPFRAPPCRCDECDGPMDFDDMEESYFAFLGSTARLAADPKLDEVVAEFTPSDAGMPRLRTRSGSISNPGGGPLVTPPSIDLTRRGNSAEGVRRSTTGDSLPSIRRGISGNHPAVPPAAVSSSSSATAAAGPAGPPLVAAGSSGRGVWILLGALMAGALAVAAWLFMSHPSG
jgi:anti-anti-sigma regulatory factor